MSLMPIASLMTSHNRLDDSATGEGQPPHESTPKAETTPNESADATGAPCSTSDQPVCQKQRAPILDGALHGLLHGALDGAHYGPRRSQEGHRETLIEPRRRAGNQRQHVTRGTRQLDSLAASRKPASGDGTDFHTYRTRVNDPKFNKPSAQRARRRASETARSRSPPMAYTTSTMPSP